MDTNKRPYIDDGDDDLPESDSSFSASSNENRYSSKTNRYSTFNNKYVAKLVNDDSIDINNNLTNNNNNKNRVTFAALPRESKQKSVSFNKKSRVKFAVNTQQNEELKVNANDEDDNKSEIESDISSQSDDLLDHIYNDQDVSDMIESGINLHNVRDSNNDMNKGRKSKFLKFNHNFFESTRFLSNGSSMKHIDTTMPIVNEYEYSHTASTCELFDNLWHSVSERSDSSDDSVENQSKKKKKKKKKKHKNQNNQNDDNLNRDEIIARFKRSVINDHATDDEEYDLNESSDEINAFPMRMNMDNSDDEDIDEDDDDSHDRMWFQNHLGHLKVLKRFFREMDKDKDGTISYEEFVKFVRRYKVDQNFSVSQIERFFLKITETKFDIDHPNAIEESNNAISPILRAQSTESVSNKISLRKSNAPKKTSIFFKKSKNVPTGEVDMATFLFYFSSPIDSQIINLENMDMASMEMSTRRATHFESMTQSLLLNKHTQSSHNNDTNRHSLVQKSNSVPRKKLNVAKKDHNQKRGSISALNNYHSQRRASKTHQIVTSDDMNLSKLISQKRKKKKRISAKLKIKQRISSKNHNNNGGKSDNLSDGLLPLSNMENNGKDTGKESLILAQHMMINSVDTNVTANDDTNIENEYFDKKFQTISALETLIKTMKRSMQCQDRRNFSNCFIGRDAVTFFLTKHFVHNRHGGLLLGRKLLQNGYIKYADDEERDFEDEITFFYQFTDREDNMNEPLVMMNLDPNHSNFPSVASMTMNTMTMPTPLEHGRFSHSATNDADTPVPMSMDCTNLIPQQFNNYDSAELMGIIGKMQHTISRTSHRSNSLSLRDDIYSGKEIIDWFLNNNHVNDRAEGVQFGLYLRQRGFIHHIEFYVGFKDDDDSFYMIHEVVIHLLNELDSPIMDRNDSHSIFGGSNKSNNGNTMNHILEHEANTDLSQKDLSRATMPNSNRPKMRQNNDSIVSNMTTNSVITTASMMTDATTNTTRRDRTSLVLGQMGRGKRARGGKREKLVQDLFTFIIKSQIKMDDTINMSQATLFQMDMLVDGIEHPHVEKLVKKIEKKFKNCDEHSRGSLNSEEFGRFLIKCGVILPPQDLAQIFKIFDKNHTGLIDYYNFSDNSLVHRVPGIQTENLTVTHLIKHTISVNFGVSSGKQGFDDQHTVISLAISAAFEEINTSQTGEITLDEFKVAYRKNGIEIYGGVTQIFNRLSRGNPTIALSNFIEAFQGTIFANRTEPPTLKEVLSKLGIIQWTLGSGDSVLNVSSGNSGNNSQNEWYDVDEISMNTATTHRSHIGNNYIGGKMLVVTPNNHHGLITPATTASAASPTVTDMAMQSNVIHHHDNHHHNHQNGGYIVGAPDAGGHTDGSGLISPTPSNVSFHTNNNDQIDRMYSGNNSSLGHITETNGAKHGRMSTLRTDTQRTSFSGDSTIIPMGVHSSLPLSDTNEHLTNRNNALNGMEKVRSETSDSKTYRKNSVDVRLNWKEASQKVFISFFKSTLVIAFPGVILNSLLHFIQAIPVNDDNSSQFPVIDLTWFIFGFLVYLALQSTMVGLEVTKSLILFFVLLAAAIGSVLAIATLIETVILNDDTFSSNSKGNIIGWWTGLFLVYLICECAARLKYMKIFGAQRTKREMIWYAISRAMGVALFWFLQTFLAVIVVSISFDDEHSKRWPIIIYCAITLTLLRGVTLISLGTAFIAKLSDHFYLEDVETMELRTDQILLTQLSIISSYSSLWYLFTKTSQNDFEWVLIGIILYQFILLLIDAIIPQFIRPKMISLLKGELIAWFAVGARALMDCIFPFGLDGLWRDYLNDKVRDYRMNIVWLLTYSLGPILLLLLLWFRVYKLWSYENIESFWDCDQFQLPSLCCCWKKKENVQSGGPMSNNKQRNRLMVICALTIGFVVSVTEAVSLWYDDADTLTYEGALALNNL